MALDLVPLWTALLALAVFYYVVFDGFDLGVGILYGLVPDPGQRSIVMISPGFLVLDDRHDEQTALIERAIHSNVVIGALDG